MTEDEALAAARKHIAEIDADKTRMRTSTARSCGCGAELIGISDGSSVYAWQCSKCAHKWPRHATVRGHYAFRGIR